jgi:hypothetical protein
MAASAPGNNKLLRPWLFVAAVLVPLWIVVAVVWVVAYVNRPNHDMTITFEPIPAASSVAER